MADPNTRQGKRTPVTLKIKFKSETLEQFIERYAVDVSQGGIFIRTKEPLAVGTQMKFEFQLRDASPLIAGEGTVVWTRENDPSRPAIAPGMGVRFDKLAEGSQQVLEKILAEKAKQAPQRAHTEQTKPPMFADTPTRVAPAPVQDALLGGGPRRARSDSEQTPLPKPVPFHSDADEFPEEAFEEATKVRSLDELVAQTAEGGSAGDKTATTVLPRDELAARRTNRDDSTLADAPEAAAPKAGDDVERESAPGLPSPPPVDASSGRKPLDTSPSPRQRKSSEQPPIEREARASQPPPSENAATTKLGLEPAKAATVAEKPAEKPAKEERTEKVSTPREAPEEPSRPAARPSNAPIIIGALVVVAAGLAALWFFVLREDAAKNAGGGSAGSAIVENTGSDVGSAIATTGSAGSDVGSASETGSAGSDVAMAGSAVVPANAVDTVIASPTAKATISIEGQSGPAPFTAKLEKGKPYKAHVTAPGFIAKDVDVTGGTKATAKLEAKPRVLSVTSEPAGATIYVDGVPTGKQTPADVTIGATRTKARITLRKAGFKPLDQQVEIASFTEEDAKLTSSLDGKLEKAPIVANPGATHTSTDAGTGTGSATTTSTGTGAGSATTGSGTTGTDTSGSSGTGTSGTTGTSTSGTGTSSTGTSGTGTSGTGTTGTSGTGTSGTSAGSATKPAGGSEPEPDWSKSK